MSKIIAELHRCVADGALDASILSSISENLQAIQECEVLDFKQQLPETDAEYAKTVRDAVALHNSYGGFLIFGIKEIEKDRAIEVIGIDQNKINIGKLRDMARSYLNHDLRIKADTQILNENIIEVIWIAKRSNGDAPLKFSKNGPDDQPRKPTFKRDQIVFRRLESNAIANTPEDYEFLYSSRRPPSIDLATSVFSQEDPLVHNLPDRSLVCSRFVGRRVDLGHLWAWLADEFSRVLLIAGEGGLGKTSLAYRFVEEVASKRVKPFQQIVWLTAKKRQFIPAQDSHRENYHIDFHDANSLFVAIARAHGCVESDFDNLTTRELLQLALTSCSQIPSFIVIDDVDSLAPEDQQRTLEMGMRTPVKTKMLLTTRVNFSYSPDNVLKLNGLDHNEFKEYVDLLRKRYNLPAVKESKINHIREVSGGSPLFTDSLLRLEKTGLPLDQSINKWKAERGMEARKAALQREVQQLSREAKRTLYIISHLKSASYVELSQILGYSEQTLNDILQELAGLFLVSAPSIGREARYTVEPNTGLLVIELVQSLGIDHAALVAASKRARTDAVGISLQKRSSIVGQAIAQSIALLKDGNAKDALKSVTDASKKLTKPNADLTLAIGRFSLKLDPPNLDQASKAFNEAYSLGQRKQLLFELWFETEFRRGSLNSALDVKSKAVENEVGNPSEWLERSALVHLELSLKYGSKESKYSAIRELDFAITDLRQARLKCQSDIRKRHIDIMLKQSQERRKSISNTPNIDIHINKKTHSTS